jgi:3-deoxy-D-manno-octulosonic-acid transferase
MVKFALIVYNLFFPFAFLLYFPVYLCKLVKRGNFLEGFGERFGLISSAKKSQLHALKDPIWIHAVSVGEAQLALPFIRYWLGREPGRQFVVSTTTATGQAIVRANAPDGVVPIYCPLDFYPCIASTLRAVRPAALLIVEVEIWPTLVSTVAGRNIFVGLINGRVSDSSASGYLKHRWLFRDIFSKFSMIAVQTPEDVHKLTAVAGELPELSACGTMKFDIVPDSVPQLDGKLLEQVFGDGEHVLLAAASTHPGEDEIVGRIYRDLVADFPNLRLLIIPRHAERGATIQRTLQELNLTAHLVTDIRNPESRNPESRIPPVLIGNTTGEMMAFLAVSDIVFVGKSLAGNDGGHNIIEPAMLGKAVIFGSGMSNFRDVARVFREAEAAVEVGDETDLLTNVRSLLADPDAREKLGANARRAVIDNRGAMAKTIEVFNTL